MYLCIRYKRRGKNSEVSDEDCKKHEISSRKPSPESLHGNYWKRIMWAVDKSLISNIQYSICPDLIRPIPHGQCARESRYKSKITRTKTKSKIVLKKERKRRKNSDCNRLGWPTLKVRKNKIHQCNSATREWEKGMCIEKRERKEIER